MIYLITRSGCGSCVTESKNNFKRIYKGHFTHITSNKATQFLLDNGIENTKSNGAYVYNDENNKYTSVRLDNPSDRKIRVETVIGS